MLNRNPLGHVMELVREFSHDDELLLYERGGIFQARVYAGDRRYVTRSLKTRDLNAARKLAERYYYEVRFKQEEARPITRKTFADVVREYVRARETQYTTGIPMAQGANHKARISANMLRQVRRVSEFWTEYGATRDIATVDNNWLRDYVEWRMDYYPAKQRAGIPFHTNASVVPKAKTLEWELVFAKTVWRWGSERGYTGKLPPPTWSIRAGENNARPPFEVADYAAIMKHLRHQGRTINDPERAYTYNMLANYVAILAATGMRPGEANNLQHSDLIPFKDELGRDNFMIKVRGKTGERVVIPRLAAVQWIVHQRHLWITLQGHLEMMGRTPKPYHRVNKLPEGDWFFRMPDGSRIGSLLEQFNRVLTETGTAVNRYGAKRSLYSLRHFYAVQMLRRGAPVYDVSRNMGTSVVMIEKHYGRQATPLALATSLGN